MITTGEEIKGRKKKVRLTQTKRKEEGNKNELRQKSKQIKEIEKK